MDQKSRSDDDEEGQEELENVMEQDFDYLKTPGGVVHPYL